MKVLFVDIDGVLVTNKSIDHYRSMGVTHPKRILDPAKVALLDRVIAATDAKIVISSDWRIGKDLFMLQTIFSYAGSGFSRNIIGVTPVSDSRKRADDITGWLAKNVVSKVAILDDLDAGWDDFSRILFQTNPDDGLTDDIADNMIHFLNG